MSRIRPEDPPSRVLIFSHHASEEDLVRATRAGGLGYVTKEIAKLGAKSRTEAVTVGMKRGLGGAG